MSKRKSKHSDHKVNTNKKTKRNFNNIFKSAIDSQLASSSKPISNFFEIKSNHIFMGFDWSKTSPSACVIIPHKQEVHFIGLKQRFRDQSSLIEEKTWMFHVHIVQPINGLDGSIERFNAYESILHAFKSVIDPILKPFETLEKYIGIEGYPLRYTGRTTALLSLIEFGTILRQYVFSIPLSKVKEFAPNIIKKSFTENGHASKADMIKAYDTMYKLPALYKNMFLHPYEDMVDALATALCLYRIVV